MKILAIFAIITAVMLIGCVEKVANEAAEEQIEAQIEAETGNEADVEIDGNTATMTLETEEGDIKIDSKVENEGSWCQTGSEWQMTGEVGEAKMVVVGVEDTGEYAGMCHVTYDVDVEGQQGNMDFYFREDGTGYQVMNINGQQMKMEFGAE